MNFERTNAPIPMPQTLSVEEVAQLLGYERTTIYRLIWRDKIKVCAGTARLRIPREEIERFLQRTETFSERSTRLVTGQPRRSTRPQFSNN